MSNKVRFMIGFVIGSCAVLVLKWPVAAIFLSALTFSIVVPIGFPRRRYD